MMCSVSHHITQPLSSHLTRILRLVVVHRIFVCCVYEFVCCGLLYFTYNYNIITVLSTEVECASPTGGIYDNERMNACMSAALGLFQKIHMGELGWDIKNQSTDSLN